MQRHVRSAAQERFSMISVTKEGFVDEHMDGFSMTAERTCDRSELIELSHPTDEQYVGRHGLQNLAIGRSKVHPRQLGPPGICELTVCVLLEIWSAERVVHKLRTFGAWNGFADEIVPRVRNLSDLTI